MEDSFEVPNLHASDSEEVELSESDSDSEPVAKKGRGLAKPYDIVQNFETEQLFKEWWDTEKSGWTLQTTLHNKKQLVRIWWCKHNEQYGGHIGRTCQVRLRVCYFREDTSVHVEQLRVDLDHTAAKTLDKIPNDLKDRIKQLTTEGVKPMRGTWVNSDLCNWHEGTTTNCANTNGLESTNKRIKADFLTRTMQAFEPFLEDDLPNVPDIPLAEMKKALELVAECAAPPGGTPRRYYLRLAGSSTYVFSSSEARFANVGELFEAYKRSFTVGPSTWEEYAERRFEVHRVFPSTKFNGPFYECSCQKGCKKNVCKHAVMVMCTLEKIYEYSAEALAKPMKHSRRSLAKQIGRPALSQKQNRFAAAD